jgi:diguanylate cyclase (GGDEF)-like protein
MLHPIEAAGEARGILLVDSAKENAYTKDDQAFLGNIAKVMGEAIYYTYLNTAHNLDYQRLAAVSSIEKDFWKDLEFDAVMDKMCGIIPHAVPCDRLTISLKEEDKMAASITRVYGEDSEGFNKLKFRLDSDAKSIASLAYTKEFGFFRNFVEDRYEPRYAENEPQVNGFASFMVVPFGIDKLKGLLLIESVKKDAFTNFNLDLLARIGTSAGLALEKISIIRKFDDLAIHDGLTELYNHRQFQKILSAKIKACARPEKQKPLSLVLCDIDHFKHLNDTYGHPFGDVVLKGVAAKLKSSIRIDIDAAARYGGEEFALIFDETDSETAKELAERIRAAIEAMSFRTTDGTEVKKTMSFGIASFNKHARDIKELIEKADKALYDAKRNGRNRVVVY